MTQKRTATFDLDGLDLEDQEQVEARWNGWVGKLFGEGYRPADEPIRWDERSVTYRLFRLADEDVKHTLNFDLTRLGALAAAVFTGAGLFVGYVIELLDQARGVAA